MDLNDNCAQEIREEIAEVIQLGLQEGEPAHWIADRVIQYLRTRPGAIFAKGVEGSE